MARSAKAGHRSSVHWGKALTLLGLSLDSPEKCPKESHITGSNVGDPLGEKFPRSKSRRLNSNGFDPLIGCPLQAESSTDGKSGSRRTGGGSECCVWMMNQLGFGSLDLSRYFRALRDRGIQTGDGLANLVTKGWFLDALKVVDKYDPTASGLQERCDSGCGSHFAMGCLVMCARFFRGVRRTLKRMSSVTRSHRVYLRHASWNHLGSHITLP